MTEEQTETVVSEQSRLAVLYKLSSKLGTSLALSEVLDQVIDSIIQLTGAERGFLMLYNDGGELKTMVSRNVDEARDSRSMQISRTVLERAATTGKGILTSNAQEDDRFSGQQSVIGFQLRSIMCAPLLARGRRLGAVYVDNRLFSGVFQPEDLELLETFANQAAIAIENARLFTQTDMALARRVDELYLFQQIDQELNRSLDLNRVLRLALDWAITLTNADQGSIGLLEMPLEEEEDGPVLRLLAYSGGEEGSEPQVVPATHPILAQVLVEGEAVAIHNVTEEQAIDKTPSDMQLCVPIKHDGKITGLITLESRQGDPLSEEDSAFVARLADRAAVAIKNSRLYEDIQAANKAKSDFISLVTHELRLPMTSIQGYVDLLTKQMAGPLNDQQSQFMGVIRRNVERMRDLVRDLSDINRIESGRMQFECEAFDLQTIVGDVVDNFAEAIASRKQTLSTSIADDLPAVYADPTRISQVLTNLVSNANKYTPDEGEITIGITYDDRFANVAVTDDGIGISEEDQARLFTQFFRAEGKEVREQAGWGLGLSIVKKMVEAQGGEIYFESEFGKGSTFTFTVPLANIEAS